MRDDDVQGHAPSISSKYKNKKLTMLNERKYSHSGTLILDHIYCMRLPSDNNYLLLCSKILALAYMLPNKNQLP